MSKNKKTVFVNGALGKMGQSVITACKSSSDLEVKYAVDVPVHPYLHDSIYSEKDMISIYGLVFGLTWIIILQ